MQYGKQHFRSHGLPGALLHQGPTGRGFQLRDGSGSGIDKNISGRIGYGLGTGIFIIYLIIRVLSGSANLDRVFFGYFPTSYLSHGT